MPLDPSIIMGVKPPEIPDPQEFQNKSLTLQNLMQQREAGQLALEKTRQATRDEAAARQAFQGGGTETDIFNRLMQVNPTAAMAYQKSREESRGREAQTAQHTATAGKQTWEVKKEQAERGASLIGMANAQNWEQVIRHGTTAGYWSPEAGEQLRAQGYSPELVQQVQRAGQTYAQQQEEQGRAATRAQTAANDPFRAGPGGEPVPQPAVQAFQTGKARAGATNVSVSTEKKYGEHFAAKIADSDVALRDSAQKAPDLAQRANNMKQIIASGKVITGAGADYKLAIGKALNLAGASDAEVIANTEALSVDMARNTLDAIKASGLGGGSGFSNADRDFLEKAAGGKISLQKETIDRLATLAHRAAEKTAKQWSDRVKQIPASSLQGTGVSADPVQVPPIYQSPGATPGAGGTAPQAFDSMPDPAQFAGKIGTDTKTGVKYKSDGKKWQRVQ